MSVIRQLSLGVTDDKRAGDFWAQALRYERRPPRYDGDDWIVLQPPPGVPGVAIAMDVSESPAEDLPRIHLDLAAPGGDVDAEVDRLVALGAQRVDWPYYPDELGPGEFRYVVLADTEGNIFCVGE